jgi:signal transduction histidine kinase
VITNYRRLSRVEAVFTAVALDDILKRIVDAQKVAAPEGVTLSLERDAELGELRADPDLLMTALENLIRNAFEALAEADGGDVVVRGVRRTGRLVLSVVDDGPGMNARTREQALNGFFTTKDEGSGLGLAFASRVAEAHGGELLLVSVEGEGTTVSLVITVE